MHARRIWSLGVLLAAFVGIAILGVPGVAQAEEKRAPANAWCGSDSEALPGDVCYVDGRTKGARRTLVIWLHGVIAKNTTWSWNHQKMLRRVAKQHGIELLFPRGTDDAGDLYRWPGTLEAQEKTEQASIEQWMSAKALLEKRDNRPFDEVFVFGFSSGAYFASSLAMRGRLDVDGYAVLAGGQPPMGARAAAHEHFAPVFVGVCSEDKSTAAHSRAFAGALAGAGIPRMVSEDKIGHDLSERHFAQALVYLRGKVKPRVATLEATVAPAS
jgi:predicted esterase